MVASRITAACLPKNPDKHLEAGCDILKQAFARAAILSNEKFRGVRLYVSENQLKITANNPEQEEAEEILDVTYSRGGDGNRLQRQLCAGCV